MNKYGISSIIFTLTFVCVFSISFSTHAFTSFPDKIDTPQEKINLQTVLNMVMFPSPNLVVDGLIGKQSIQAIKDFQLSKGLPTNGNVGPLTRSALEQAQVDKPGSSSIRDCYPGDVFSGLTGLRCANLPSGCTSSTGFSPLNGAFCGRKIISVISATIIADTTGPVISSVSSSSITDTTATITWTTDENSTSVVEYGLNTSYGSTQSSGTLVTSHTINLTGLTASTTYHYRVTSVDASTNSSTSTDYTFVTDPTPDTTGPVISSVSSSSITDTTATITWTTDENSTSVVEYGLNTSYGSTQSSGTLVTSHTINLTGLTASTTYHYRVTSVDASTNSSTSTDYTFVTDPTYVAEYQAVYDAMTVKPSSTYADAQNAMVSSLVTAGIWSQLDLFYLFAQNNATNSSLNWVAPTGDDNITVTGTPTFTLYEGYTGALNAHLNTNWNPATEGVDFTQNSASVFYYSRSNTAEYKSAFGAYQSGVAGIYDVSTTGGGVAFQHLNSIGATSYNVIFGNNGFYVYDRPSAPTFYIYENNLDIATSALNYTSSGVPSLDLYVLAAHEDASVNNFWVGQMSAFGAGSSLDNTERATLQTAIETYMDVLGKGVIN